MLCPNGARARRGAPDRKRSVLEHCPCKNCRACGATQVAIDTLGPPVCGGGRPHELRARQRRVFPTRRYLRGQNLQGCQARRSSRRATNQVRVGDHYENRQGSRHQVSLLDHAAGDQGNRMYRPSSGSRSDVFWPIRVRRRHAEICPAADIARQIGSRLLQITHSPFTLHRFRFLIPV